MKKYRFDALKASLQFDNSFFAKSMDHCLDIVTSKIDLGRVVALDETILATESKQAAHEKMVVYIPGKPHPKGLLIRGLCGKFERSNCVFFMYGQHMHKRSTCGVGNTSVSLLTKLQSHSTVEHIVLIDGAYPCRRILKPSSYESRSIHICSVTKAPISGTYNHLADACFKFIQPGQHATMVQQDTGLVATLHNSAGKEIVLVSDGVSFEDPSAYPNSQNRTSLYLSSKQWQWRFCPSTHHQHFGTHFLTRVPIPMMARLPSLHWSSSGMDMIFCVQSILMAI